MAGTSATKELIPHSWRPCFELGGIDAHISNAGVPFDTTAMMLRRVDRDVPNGTDIVILQPGSNDLRFFGTLEQRTANVAEMARRLRAPSIKVLVYDEPVPPRYYTFDFIHWTREGHAIIAAALLPRVLAVLDRGRSGEPAGYEPAPR